MRMILNFGHTFGHAIEKIFGYEKYTHGEAISIGMVYISELSEKLGFCDPKLPERIRSILVQYGLPADFPKMDSKAVIDAVFVDKKARTNDINLVMIKKPGTVFIKKFPKEQMGGIVNENRYNKPELSEKYLYRRQKAWLTGQLYARFYPKERVLSIILSSLTILSQHRRG